MRLFYFAIAVFLGVIYVQAFFDTHLAVEREIKRAEFLRGKK